MCAAVVFFGKNSALWADGEEAAVTLKSYLVYSQCESRPNTLNKLKYLTRFTQGKGGHFGEMQALIWAGFDPNGQLKEGHDHEQRASPASASAALRARPAAIE